MELADLAGFPRAITVGAAIFGAALIYRAVRHGIVALTRQGHLNESMAHRLTRVVRWTVVGSTLLVVVEVIGIFHNAWAVLSAFLATAAVAFFALWSVLSNAVCSLMILFYRPFRLGDHIEIVDAAQRYSGQVRDMNLMFTTLVESDEEGVLTLVYVPNNLMFQRPVRCRARADMDKSSFFTPDAP